MQRLTLFRALAELIFKHSASLMTKTITDSYQFAKGMKPLLLEVEEKVFLSEVPSPLLNDADHSRLLALAPELAQAFERLLRDRCSPQPGAEVLAGLLGTPGSAPSFGMRKNLQLPLFGDQVIPDAVALGKMIALADTICDVEFWALTAQQIESGVRPSNFYPFSAEIFVESFEAAFGSVLQDDAEMKHFMRACAVSFVRRLKEFTGFFSSELEKMIDKARQLEESLSMPAESGRFAYSESRQPLYTSINMS